MHQFTIKLLVNGCFKNKTLAGIIFCFSIFIVLLLNSYCLLLLFLKIIL